MSARRSARISKKSQHSSATPSPIFNGPIDKYLVTSNSSKRKQSWLTPPDQEEQFLKQQKGEDGNKRQRYQIQNQWQPITSCEQISTKTLVPSPAPHTSQRPCHQAMAAAGASCYSFRNIFSCQSSRCPLPPLKWGDSQDVWDALKSKENKYIRDKGFISRHPQLQYRMRAILLDWIIEVCEVYRLHRETFYLAGDFIDRYLSAKDNVQKYQLQLIGATALFIAAKLEEIYPPKIGEFAYVTDGACTEEDITKQELIMLKTLKWDLCPMTINSWITLYLNILNHRADPHSAETCLTEINFSSHSFLKITRLMDLCTLDEESLHFPYSVLSAAILYHFCDESTVQTASGYRFEEIERCVGWLAPFAITTRELSVPVARKSFDNVLPEDQHNIQTHDITVALLDKAKARQQMMNLPTSRASPNITEEVPDILTPPPTRHKHSNADDESSDINSGPFTSQPTTSEANIGTRVSGVRSTRQLVVVSSGDSEESGEDDVIVLSTHPSIEDLHI